MDDYTYLSQLIEEDEEVAEEERVLQAAAAAMIIYLGAEEYWALRAQRRQPSWLYLCRPQLKSDPRDPSGSPRSVIDKNIANSMAAHLAGVWALVVMGEGERQRWNERRASSLR